MEEYMNDMLDDEDKDYIDFKTLYMSLRWNKGILGDFILIN